MTGDPTDVLHRAGLRLALAASTAVAAYRAGLIAAGILLLADDPEAVLEQLADGDVGPDPTVVATILALANRKALP